MTEKQGDSKEKMQSPGIFFERFCGTEDKRSSGLRKPAGIDNLAEAKQQALGAP